MLNVNLQCNTIYNIDLEGSRLQIPVGYIKIQNKN